MKNIYQKAYKEAKRFLGESQVITEPDGLQKLSQKLNDEDYGTLHDALADIYVKAYDDFSQAKQTKMRKNIYYLKFIADVSNQKHECDLMTTVLIVQDSNAEELYTRFSETAITEFKKLYGHNITSKDIQWKVISLIDSSEIDSESIEFVIEHQKPVDGQYYWIQLFDNSERIQLAKYCAERNSFYVFEDYKGEEPFENVHAWYPQVIKKPTFKQLTVLPYIEETTIETNVS